MRIIIIRSPASCRAAFVFIFLNKLLLRHRSSSIIVGYCTNTFILSCIPAPPPSSLHALPPAAAQSSMKVTSSIALTPLILSITALDGRSSTPMAITAAWRGPVRATVM